jgi:hypothetical protein
VIRELAVSDQLDDWSDQLDTVVRRCLAPETCRPTAATTAVEGDPAGVGNRTLQAVWEGGVQVRTGPWTRSQALFVREPARGAAGDGVRAGRLSRASERVSGKPPPNPRGARGDLRDQPGAAATPRGAWLRAHAAPGAAGHRSRGHAGRQYDPGLSGVEEPGCRAARRELSGRAGYVRGAAFRVGDKRAASRRYGR